MFILAISMAWGWFVLLLLGVLIAGAIIGFFVSRKVFQAYLEKNPPVNEKMIRVMMQLMGRTPSEKQVRQIMASINQAKNK